MIKKIVFIVLGTMLISFGACDYIDNPIPPTANSGDACPDEIFPVNNSPIRKVLLEDYTGHLCPNCPAAATIIEDDIVAVYGEKVIPVSIHAGPFALATGSPWTNDFKTAAGDNYNSSSNFHISSLGNPNGMVNRIDYDLTTKAHIKSKDKWVSLVDSLTQKVPEADIQIKNIYDDNTKKVCVHIETKFLTALTGKYNLVVLLLQDSITGPQKNGSATISDYVHRHVLRAAVNGEEGDGEEIAGDTTTIINGTKIYKKYEYEVLSAYKNIPCDVSHCHILAFVYNATTREVLQAEEEKIK